MASISFQKTAKEWRSARKARHATSPAHAPQRFQRPPAVPETILRIALAGALLSVATPACRDEGPTTAPKAASAGTAVEIERLRIVLPATWERGAPTSPMRILQAKIPGAAGAGEMAVFFFGAGQGGGVDANLKRWIAQMDSDPGTIPQRDVFESNGFTVTAIDITGTILPGQMGMGPKSPLPDHRLLGAVVEGPGGPWFFKATGPKETLGAERDRFLEMLRTLEPR